MDYILGKKYYVSNLGSNQNTGLSLQDAFLTIQYAADIVVPGECILVADGNYSGFIVKNKKSLPETYVTIKSLDRKAIVDRSCKGRKDGIIITNSDYVVIDGLNIRNIESDGDGIFLEHSDNCVIRNCVCEHNGNRGILTSFTDDILIEYNTCCNSVLEHGIYVSNSSKRPVVRYNECYGNNSIGIHMNGDLSCGGDGIIDNAEIYGNIIHDNNAAAGINLDGVRGVSIYDNLIYNNHFSHGITLFQEDGGVMTNSADICRNTIFIPLDGKWGIEIKNKANINTRIMHNTIINFNREKGSLFLENTDHFKSDFNVLNKRSGAEYQGKKLSLNTWKALGFDIHSRSYTLD